MHANKLALKPLVAAATFTFVHALTAAAHAGDAAAAEALFNEARKAMAQGNFAAACPQLEESQKQDPGMGTLYNLGDCYEKLGKTASAWAAFSDVAAQAKAAGQGPREADARARAAALEPKLSRLTIVVEGPTANVEGLTIKRGTTVVGKATWGLALPVDPGEHAVEISAPGKEPATAKVQVAPNGAAVRFAVPVLKDAAVAAAPAGPASALPPPQRDQTPSRDGDADRGSSQRILGLVVGGIGVVGLGLGSVFGLQSMSKKSDGDEHCKPDNKSCDAAGVKAREDAISAGNLSTIFFVIGGVASVGGATLYLTAPKARAAGLGVRAVAAPGGGLISLGGRFQ